MISDNAFIQAFKEKRITTSLLPNKQMIVDLKDVDARQRDAVEQGLQQILDTNLPESGRVTINVAQISALANALGEAGVVDSRFNGQLAAMLGSSSSLLDIKDPDGVPTPVASFIGRDGERDSSRRPVQPRGSHTAEATRPPSSRSFP